MKDVIIVWFAVLGFGAVGVLFLVLLYYFGQWATKKLEDYKWKKKYKNRFNKEPTARCYCNDCSRYYKEKTYCDLLDRYTPDDGFCYEADPRRSDPDICEKEQEGKVFAIRPKEALHIGAMEKNPQELERVYQLGRKAAMERLEDLKAYLNQA